MTEPTTIHWLTLPRNGNGGAALVTWRASTNHTVLHKFVNDWNWGQVANISYLLGDKPPRYPVPATRLNTGPSWLDFWWARNIVLYGIDF